MSQVKIKVFSASDLTLTTEEGWSDPYCKITVAGQSVTIKHARFTVKKSKSKAPVWEKTVLFTDLGDEKPDRRSYLLKSLITSTSSKPSGPEKLQVLVEILDVNDDEIPTCIGSVLIPFINLVRGKQMTNSYPLKHAKSGSVKVGLTAVDFGLLDDDQKPSDEHVEQLRYGQPPPSLKEIKKSEALKTKILLPLKKQIPCREYEQKELKRKSEVGKGTFGIVYKGKVKGLDEVVVIKDMNVSSHSKIIDEWRKEIELMRWNKCRYVTRVLGFGVNQLKLTIVMEYMERGSLYDVLYKKPPKTFKFPFTIHFGERSLIQDVKNLSLVQRLRMARHCVRGLVFLHQNGVLHCDIKSPNILVSKDYTCKLTDFGCAKVLAESAGKDTRGIGSPLWAAPETKTSQYTKPADVYSMGLVLYEIFEGKLPRWNRKVKIAVLPEAFNAQQIILPCVNHDYPKRPTAEALLDSLDRWVTAILRDFMDHSDEKTLNEIGIKSQTDISTISINDVYNYLISKVDGAEVDNLLNHLDVMPPSPSNIMNDQVVGVDDDEITTSLEKVEK